MNAEKFVAEKSLLPQHPHITSVEWVKIGNVRAATIQVTCPQCGWHSVHTCLGDALSAWLKGAPISKCIPLDVNEQRSLETGICPRCAHTC